MSKRFRYYNIFFDHLIHKLSEKHDVVTDRYRKDAHKGQSNILLELVDDEVSCNILTYECELILENLTDNEIIIFSVADDLTSTILNLSHLDNVKKIFVSQFIRDKIYHHVSETNQHKYYPWIYFPSNDLNLDIYYNLRCEKKEFIDKMYFRGSTSYRPILDYFTEDCFFGGNSLNSFESYMEEMINYSMSVSIAGRGEFCYRDIECMAIGIPLIRFEYLSEMYEPLIPNYHYISVERPEDLRNSLTLDRMGNKEHSQMIMNRFNEIKENKEFLDFISKNARKYYEDFLSPNSSVETTIKILDL
jgi:hypothetical protein